MKRTTALFIVAVGLSASTVHLNFGKLDQRVEPVQRQAVPEFPSKSRQRRQRAPDE